MSRVLALVVDGPFVAEFPFCIWHHAVAGNYSVLTTLAFCVILRCIFLHLALHSCYFFLRLLKLISGLIQSLWALLIAGRHSKGRILGQPVLLLLGKKSCKSLTLLCSFELDWRENMKSFLIWLLLNNCAYHTHLIPVPEKSHLVPWERPRYPRDLKLSSWGIKIMFFHVLTHFWYTL